MEGGRTGWGTVFSLTTSGKERVLYSFKAQPDGAYPFAGLINMGGKLYGTAKEGGSAGYGAVFRVTTSGQEHVIYSFKGGNDGAYPYAALLEADGGLYGTTYQGGQPNWGTIFRLDTSGKEKILHVFQAQDHGDSDGAYPLLPSRSSMAGCTEPPQAAASSSAGEPFLLSLRRHYNLP